MIGHELIHVGQYQKLGKLGFARKYLSEYRKNRKEGASKKEAYEAISFERRASDFQDAVNSFLADNPGILNNIQEGEELNESDTESVRDAIREALSECQLREGYQFIEGKVYCVQIL